MRERVNYLALGIVIGAIALGGVASYLIAKYDYTKKPDTELREQKEIRKVLEDRKSRL